MDEYKASIKFEIHENQAHDWLVYILDFGRFPTNTLKSIIFICPTSNLDIVGMPIKLQHIGQGCGVLVGPQPSGKYSPVLSGCQDLILIENLW